MNIDQIEKLSAGYRTAKILHTAVDVNLFDHLENGSYADHIAREISSDPRVTEHILNALVALGIIEKKDDRYYHTETSRKFLTTQSELSRLNTLKHSAEGWEKWGQLPTLLETGNLPERSHTYDDSERYRRFLLAMDELQQPHAKDVAKRLPILPGMNILDCGGGPGTYARAFSEVSADLNVTLFDLPAAMPIAQSLEDGHSIRYRAGDFFTDDLGGSYDGIFLSNIIHSWSPEENQKLIRRLSGQLSSGSWLVIRDKYLNEEKSGPLGAVIFGINMILSNNRGRCYTVSEVKTWMQNCELTEIRYERVKDHSELIIGIKE